MARLVMLLFALAIIMSLSTFDLEKNQLYFHQIQDVLSSAKYLYSNEDLKEYPVQAGQTIDEINGLLVADYEKHKISWVPLDRIPKDFRNAVIAIEDSRFYSHDGVDLQGVARAILVNLKEGDFVEGGSTITQQLAKNLFLTQDKTIARKVEELLIAIRLEELYRKDQILEMYLNQIYFGHGSYGVEKASNKIFGKKVSELDLAESTILAGIIKGPGIYSPLLDEDKALDRQAIVLQRMVDKGFITPQEKDKALLIATRSFTN